MDVEDICQDTAVLLHSWSLCFCVLQSINIMERTLQKYGSYEQFERATGGSLLTKSRIWNHVRKYMVKEGCLGEVSLTLERERDICVRLRIYTWRVHLGGHSSRNTPGIVFF